MFRKRETMRLKEREIADIYNDLERAQDAANGVGALGTFGEMSRRRLTGAFGEEGGAVGAALRVSQLTERLEEARSEFERIKNELEDAEWELHNIERNLPTTIAEMEQLGCSS